MEIPMRLTIEVVRSSWTDRLNQGTHGILSLIAVFSLLSLLIQLGVNSRNKPSTTKPPNTLDSNSNQNDIVKRAVDFHGGWIIFALAFTRAVGCISLLAISSVLQAKKYKAAEGCVWAESNEIVFFYIYATVLSFASLSYASWQSIVSKHSFLLLLSALLVDAYRNVWPLATYTEASADAQDGPLLPIRIFILFTTSVLIPLLSPRKYQPLDPEEPSETPNPEQTTPLLSLMMYTFLNPLLLLAARLPHLGHDQLYPLADYDYAKNTTKRAFLHLDLFQGAKKRHLFFGLMSVYRYEYSILTITIIIQAIANLASPWGINQILHYLETGGRDATIRPWFWILWLFVGPMAISLSRQWYIFVATRILRIRMKAETDDQGDKLIAVKGGGKRKADNLIGKINNLVTTDLMNVVEARDFLFLILYHPLQMILCIFFLYRVLGVSSFAGLAVILAMAPIPVYLAKLIQDVQVEQMKMTDSRVQAVTEACNVLRMIKLFGWESEMHDRIANRRDEEMHWWWKRNVYDLTIAIINFVIPAFTMLVTYGVYTVIMKEKLSAAKVFSSISVFVLLRRSLQNSVRGLSVYVQGKVSLDRLTDFLQNTELLDSLAPPSEKPSDDYQNQIPQSPQGAIGFHNAMFTWSKISRSSLVEDTQQSFTLRIDGDLLFKQGSINLIVGPTGSGKTSFLMALLGEMHYIPQKIDSWCSLPREKGVAYAAQESWVQNDTIRGNIVFGSPFNEGRYRSVIHQCGLERDLELFEAGDLTEVGEKGLSLSGGQKARITLARAVYSDAEILLLDDILAALDVHTSAWIVEHCLSGPLVRGRTIILVTHNITLTSRLANFVVSMGNNGTVLSQGTDLTPLRLLAEIEKQDAQPHGAKDAELSLSNDAHDTSSKGKLIVPEEIQQGHVTWKAMKLFFSALSGNHPVVFILGYSMGLLLADLGTTFQMYLLGYWGSQYVEHNDPQEINPFFYLGGYSLILVVLLLVFISSELLYLFGVIRACTTIHKKLIDSIMGTTFRWLDQTPTSRIITRCTQDIRAVDGPIAQWTIILTEMTLSIVVKVVAIVIFSPVFLVPTLLVAVIGGWLANFYLKAQLSVKREMSNAKAPVLAHFGAAIAGLTSIRAYGAQDAFRQESLKRIDYYSRAARVSYNLNRWIAVRIDVLGALFTTGLATYLVYASSVNAANIGFSLNLAVDFCGMILMWVRFFNDLEVQANSLERIQGYIEIEQEPKRKNEGVPPAAWPTSGHLFVKNLYSRYSPDGPNVLHGITFEMKSGEHIGVVGRTGSGKSSLMLSLLRCIVIDGDIYYDGLNTKDINLDSLRSKITIIPQIPELISGTLRRNLDPFEQNDDATLNAALRASGLFSLQREEHENRLTLDSKIASGGTNMSVGQRQILALARAMVRESKLLILDEATSAIDHKTDALIQESLRHNLGSDVSVITVAHRLHTIMDADKILVLDAGRIVEYDAPAALLAKPAGSFKAMVDGSGDKDQLYSIVYSASKYVGVE